MFGLGFTEILLIAILALLFIGPDKLPDTMKSIARTLGKLKRMVDDTKSTLEQELRVDDLRQEVMQYRAELDKAKSDLNAFKNIANKEIESVKNSASMDGIEYKPTDINDDKLFDEMFKEAEAEFEELEKDNKESQKIQKSEQKESEGFKNLKDNKLAKDDSTKKEEEDKLRGFKNLDRKSS